MVGSNLRRAAVAFAACLIVSLTAPLFAASPDANGAETTRHGYYRFPAVHGDTIVFNSEGDLWTVSIKGGVAHRLTTGTGEETEPTISPDGKTVEFLADYEGPSEVYTMPVGGGLPERRTWEGDVQPEGWSRDGRLMIATSRYSTLPGDKLVLIDSTGKRDIVPLAEAAEAAWSADGHTLFFSRWFKQFSETKRYKGGWNESLWRFDGTHEAQPLTADYDGTSAHPMVWNGRVYCLSDRDGIMNVWSMNEEGKDLKEESHQKIFDVESASVSDGHVVYASAADLWDIDLASGHEDKIPVTLESDFDQMRQHWVKKPLEYLTEVHISPDGSAAVFTARGEIFSIPANKYGRIVKVASDPSVRYREARFLPDGKSILALSTQSGETEFWKFPANGVGKPEQWTNDAKVLRWDGVVSPDGRWLAHTNKDQELWLYDIKAGQEKRIEKSENRGSWNRRIAQSRNGDFGDLRWSPDSKWLAYSETADNSYQQIKLLNVDTSAIQTITDDRFNSGSPEWSADGKWLYFLSDRNLKTSVPAPWGPREPEPHFDKTVKIYQVALADGLRSPFLPPDELHPDKPAEKKPDETKPETEPETKPADAKETKAADKKPADSTASAKPEDKKADANKPSEKKPPEVKIDFAGLADRVTEVPVPAGNYGALQATAKRLCWVNSADPMGAHASLQCLEIANKGEEPETVMSDIRGFEISADRKKMLVTKKQQFYIFDSEVKNPDPKAQGKAEIDLSHWVITTNPRQEYHGMFLDAWRLERDYFYDPHMHGVNWPQMRERYLPLVDRVSDRNELNDVIAQMVSELSALHTFVRGGDARQPDDHIGVATFGARLRRDEKAGGFVVEHIYAHDPDLPDQAPPFARPDSLVKEGEVITSIDGVDALSVQDETELLRDKAGQQVLIHVKDAKGGGRDVLVKPVSFRDDGQLRYNEWEYTRRLAVDKASNDTIGYVHLRAMGSGDMDQWARDFYPVYNRQGLIIDVRHNHGGNIDSWLLSKLLRQAWFYFQPRVGNPSWDMQYAFRGHIVVLCDHETASDGEAFSEGFKRLKLGKVIGMRTWGGEIWLSFGDTAQADNGVASAAETGVYADGKWLVEGHGVDPDIVVDNLPHDTYSGDDAQLKKGIEVLEEEIKADPRPVPPPPPHPDKSFKFQQ
ncbi:MAG TPA: S41 family peptidase [Terracidiphilus sp.]|nr:S41 family peptidase [Terracidiphilus sp.]